jgi:hypothetical protein
MADDNSAFSSRRSSSVKASHKAIVIHIGLQRESSQPACPHAVHVIFYLELPINMKGDQ